MLFGVCIERVCGTFISQFHPFRLRSRIKLHGTESNPLRWLQTEGIELRVGTDGQWEGLHHFVGQRLENLYVDGYLCVGVWVGGG